MSCTTPYRNAGAPGCFPTTSLRGWYNRGLATPAVCAVRHGCGPRTRPNSALRLRQSLQQVEPRLDRELRVLERVVAADAIILQAEAGFVFRLAVLRIWLEERHPHTPR